MSMGRTICLKLIKATNQQEQHYAKEREQQQQHHELQQQHHQQQLCINTRKISFKKFKYKIYTKR